MSTPFSSIGGTLETGTMTGGQRWFPIWNTETEAIPPFSCVEIFDGYRDADDLPYCKVRKPTGTSGAIIALTGALAIPAYQSGTPANKPAGMATLHSPAWMAFTSSGTPASNPQNGDTYGAKSGSWVGDPSGSDFVVIGDQVTTGTPSRVLVIFPGGGNCPPCNAIWAIVIFGPPTGTSFALKFNGQTTATFPHNVSAAAMQAGLVALPNIGNDADGNPNVKITGTAFSWQIEFQNDLGGQPITGLSIASATLIGGSVYGAAILPYILQQGRE